MLKPVLYWKLEIWHLRILIQNLTDYLIGCVFPVIVHVGFYNIRVHNIAYQLTRLCHVRRFTFEPEYLSRGVNILLKFNFGVYRI